MVGDADGEVGASIQLSADERPSLWTLFRESMKRPRERRASLFLHLVIIFVLQSVRYLNFFFQALDRIFFPAVKDQAVEAPFFIIANPRSGTTLLHRLISLDEERFTYQRLYQACMPSVTAHKLVQFGKRINRLLGGVPQWGVGWIDRTVFSFWDGIHPMALNEAEEDEAIFLFKMASVSPVLLMPTFEKLKPVQILDNMSVEVRDDVMSYYKGSLQRHLFAMGDERAFLGKNVLSSGRIRSIRHTFPDARIVYLVRHPYEAIPSFVSMFSKPWSMHTPTIARRSPECRELARVAIDLYRHVYEVRQSVADTNFMDVRYDDLTNDPEETVLKIYEAMGMTAGEGFKGRLAEATAKSRKYKSSHQYNFEEFGITKREIYLALQDVFEAYDFDADGADVA